MLNSILKSFLEYNKRLSEKLDQMLPDCYREGGNDHFRSNVVPYLLKPDMRVYDLGGGSRPCLSAEEKTELRLVVIGVDVDADELSRAPVGSYDKSIVADLTRFVGHGDGDLAICQSTLEHVTDTSAAMRGISSTLKPGGLASIFAPNRNALFARINLLLPENFKRKILFTFFPNKALGHDGFKAYYANCTPNKLRKIADTCGLDFLQEHAFWKSTYFSVFFPAYLLWRLWTIVGRSLIGSEVSENFILVFRKRS